MHSARSWLTRLNVSSLGGFNECRRAREMLAWEREAFYAAKVSSIAEMMGSHGVQSMKMHLTRP
jgi:hypothetical protein